MRNEPDLALSDDDPDDSETTYEDDGPGDQLPSDDEEGDEDEDDDHAADPGRTAVVARDSGATIDDEGAAEGGEIADAELSSRVPRWARLGDLVLEYKHWKNPRTFTGLDDVSLRALADDILLKTKSTGAEILVGLDEPLRVVRIAVNGGIVELVLDGQRRHRAAHLARLGDNALVPVRDREPEPVVWSEATARQYLREVLTVVGLREGLSAFELSESAEGLRGTKDLDSKKELTLSQIARIIGRSESWVSKILTARSAATPKLLHRWRSGEISEEQFRDLAVGSATKQDEEAERVSNQRQAGDKSAARRSAKENAELARVAAREERERKQAEKMAEKMAKAETAKAAKAAKKQTASADKERSRVEPPAPAPKTSASPKAPAKPRTLSPSIVEDLMESSKKRPATHELVKGIILGIQVGTGRIVFEDLPKPWHNYVHYLAGTRPDKGPKKRAKKR